MWGESARSEAKANPHVRDVTLRPRVPDVTGVFKATYMYLSPKLDVHETIACKMSQGEVAFVITLQKTQELPPVILSLLVPKHWAVAPIAITTGED